jgi:hypothetical protein
VKDAGRGFFPLDERWGLTGSVYSPACAQQMVWLAGAASSYQLASEIFERIGRRHVPKSSIWRQVTAHGERLKAHVEHQQELVSVERVKLPAAGADHDRRKGVSIDGGMVHIREEGWKEFKAGTLSDIVMRAERDPLTGEWAEQAGADAIRYVAVLGDPSRFAPALWAAAVAAEVPQAAESSVTADGAAWIWNLAADLFPDSVQIVDWYHACEHLAQASQALYPDDTDAADRWYRYAKDYLFQGEVFRIIHTLLQADLADHAHYFQTHQRRMQYHQFRDEGFPIGSGTVESGIKQFKARLTGPGMRWSRPAAQSMLVIRGAVLDGSFNSLWENAA